MRASSPRTVRRAPPLFTVCAFVTALLALALATRVAGAHDAGVSRGEYRASGAVLHARYVFSGAELATTFRELDTDHDHALSPAEVADGTSAFAAEVLDATHVTEDGDACPSRLEAASLRDGDAVEVRASFVCPRVIRHLAIDLELLESFPAGHTHLALVALDGRETPIVASRAHERLEIEASRADPEATSFARMVAMGVRHILTGYDHLAFLLALLLLGGRVRALVGVVTAFTVAHSLTLALAALRVVSLRPSFVEPAIALSIVYVALENLVVRDPSNRWRLTFVFGLLHGFGFAGALTDLDLPRAQLPVALFGFNLGVELGQLAVLAVLLPVLLRARRREWFRRWGVSVLSVALALAGGVWFVGRAFG